MNAALKMNRRKIFDIPGGIHPPQNKAQSLQQPLGNVSLPAELVLPLSQHIGAPAKPVVSVGDEVLKGQLVADAEGFVSVPLHAPTSGRIGAIEARPLPHASGMSGPCIILVPDGKEQWCELQPCPDYRALGAMDLLEKIRQAGINGLGGAGFPAAVKLGPPQPIDTLIINGTECEPYITADDMLMRVRSRQIIEGIQILAHILGQPQQVIIGIEDNKPEAIAAMRAAAEGSGIEIAVFPTKYPSGGEKQLIQILTGKEVPSGRLPADLGIVVQNVGTAAAVRDAILEGKPLISRITTVVGETLEIQRNIEVLLGTPIAHILEEHGFEPSNSERLIMGGPMMGFALTRADLPVVKTTNCILAPSKQELPAPPPAQACIRCGMCAEACPVNLLPQQLFWYAQSKDYEKLEAHNLFDCIECGACSYVCPSNIPLVQYYRASKGAIRQVQEEKRKSDHARQRFEARQARLEKAEAEKAAKREARKKAAEQAKRQAAEAAAKGQAQPTDPKADLIAAAMARVQAQQADPTQQRAKLQRALETAQGRVEKMQAALQEAREHTPEQAEKIEAKLKDAEQRLVHAQQKLDEFQNQQSAAPAPAADATPSDAASAAIERAKAKASMSPLELARSQVESLKSRISKATDKVAKAREEGSEHAEAFATNLDKLRKKLQVAQDELAQLSPAEDQPLPQQETDAASAAIEKAKAKAEAMAAMSPEQQKQAQLESLRQRLAKNREKLAAAEAEGADHVDALRLGVEKMEAKLAKLQREL